MNIWKKFQQLLPNEPKLVGTVNAIYGNGFYEVTLLGGGSVRAYSDATYTNNDKVFIIGKQIDSKAPDFELITIEV